MPRPKRDASRQAGELEADIVALERVANAAEDDKAYSPAVTARSRLPSLRTELHRLRDLDAIAGETDPLERVRLTRRIAEREGSWQAVARLASVEADLEAKLAAAKAADEAARLANLTPDDLVTMVEDAFAALPANMRTQVLARLTG